MKLFDKYRRKKHPEPVIAKVSSAEEEFMMTERQANGDKNTQLSCSYITTYPKIRLFYVYMNDEGRKYVISNSFIIPKGFSVDEACKVISFCVDKILKNKGYPISSKNCMNMLANLLYRCNFNRVNSSEHGVFAKLNSQNEDHIIASEDFEACKEQKRVRDLFFVEGDTKKFKKSDLYGRYFKWYTKGVNENDIKKIYAIHDNWLDVENICHEEDANANK